MALSDEATTTEATGADEKSRLDLTVEITDGGPCQKHIKVQIPRSDIESAYGEVVGELATTATVPGFRVGHVPTKLIQRRFKTEVNDELKKRLLMESMDQVAAENDLDPINEPSINVEVIEIPDEGDFTYEFDVEVRPQFDLPEYSTLTIKRPVREVTEEEVNEQVERFLSQFGTRETVEGAAEPADFVTASVLFERDGERIHKIDTITLRIRPVLRFKDAELADFDTLMTGVKAGETREADVEVSSESEVIEMRGVKVKATFTIQDVRRQSLPDIDQALLEQIGVESEEQLRKEVRDMLERQVKYHQRQTTRTQVIEKIIESADWDLPEQLVLKQVENAMRRQILEMKQAGFSRQEILAHENELRQRAVSTTRQALKEHFVLDKIAEQENIDVTPQDIESEIYLMALQAGENPRRVRARLEKSGVIENLEAQIRERKAVDIVLERATYEDEPWTPDRSDRVEAVAQSVCGVLTSSGEDEVEADEDEA